MVGTRRIVTLHPHGRQAGALTSHTLFGATCWALAVLGEDIGAVLGGFEQAARFAFGAPFPFLRGPDGRLVLLLPRPPFQAELPERDDAQVSIQDQVDRAKEVGKATYLSAGVAQQLSSGAWRVRDLVVLAERGDLWVVGSALFTAEEVKVLWGWQRGHPKRDPKLPWKRLVVTRNSVDRRAGATVAGLLFQYEETLYDPELGGLWFGLWSDDGYLPKLESAFRYLQDTGLGGKRSVGKGHYSFQWHGWDDLLAFGAVPAQQRFVSLSHYIPTSGMDATPVAYALDTLRQKAEHRFPQDGQRVYAAQLRAFAPGGVFEIQEPAREVYGRLMGLGLARLAGSEESYQTWYSGLTLPLWGSWEV